MPTLATDDDTNLLYEAIFHRAPEATAYDVWRDKPVMNVVHDMRASGEWQAYDNQLKDNLVRADRFHQLANILGLDINKDGMDGVIAKVQQLQGAASHPPATNGGIDPDTKATIDQTADTVKQNNSILKWLQDAIKSIFNRS